MDENFRIGVANCAAFCACLSANYHLSAKARTEINFAADCTKHIITLVVDDESREQCWLQAHIHGKPTVDFSSPDRDEESIQCVPLAVCPSLSVEFASVLTLFLSPRELIDILGTRGMVVKRKTGAPVSHSGTAFRPANPRVGMQPHSDVMCSGIAGRVTVVAHGIPSAGCVSQVIRDRRRLSSATASAWRAASGYASEFRAKQ